MQSCQCGEIIVVDDGSNDGTGEYISSIQGKCITPVRYLWQENRGPAAARNIGIKHARYDYITFLDSDDHWCDRKIEKQFMTMASNPHYLISNTQEKWLRRGEHLNRKKKHLPKQGNIFSQCLKLCVVGMSTVMVRKELFDRIGSFDESFRCCEDYDLWLRISSMHPFLLVDEVLTVKEGGRTDQVSEEYRVGMDKLRIAAIENLLKHGILNTEQTGEAMRELVKKTVVYGSGCVRHGKIAEGERYLQRAAAIKEIIKESMNENDVVV